MPVYPTQRSMWRADGSRRLFFVYVMSNASMTMYTGITNDLQRRVGEHLRGESDFTSRYHFDRLVYYETYDLATDAIGREKAIKGLSRAKKIALVKTMNAGWRHLFDGLEKG